MATATAAPAAAGGSVASTLSPELKAQFCEKVTLLAVRVPKQGTAQAMKLLSK